MKTVCCLCRKVKEPNGWMRNETGGSAGMSHGYCPECYRKTIRKISSHQGLRPFPRGASSRPVSG